MPMVGRSLKDVKRNVLGGSSMHHLSEVAYTIRFCNSLVEYDVSYAGGKYNIKDWQMHLQNLTSIFIHKLGSYKCYKRCHMTYVQVVEMKPTYQK
jgi:hypothetical protein